MIHVLLGIAVILFLIWLFAHAIGAIFHLLWIFIIVALVIWGVRMVSRRRNA